MQTFLSEVANFAIVLVTAVGVASIISSLYASGLRLWAAGALDSNGNPHLFTRLCAVVCFTACVAIVLFALWLMIPAFH